MVIILESAAIKSSEPWATRCSSPLSPAAAIQPTQGYLARSGYRLQANAMVRTMLLCQCYAGFECFCQLQSESESVSSDVKRVEYSRWHQSTCSKMARQIIIGISTNSTWIMFECLEIFFWRDYINSTKTFSHHYHSALWTLVVMTDVRQMKDTSKRSRFILFNADYGCKQTISP